MFSRTPGMLACFVSVLAVTVVSCQSRPTNSLAERSARVSKAVAGPSLNRGKWKVTIAPPREGGYLIQVSDSDGRVIEIFEGPFAPGPYAAEHLISMEDLNGDGWPELIARGERIGVSALTAEMLYTFNPATGQFKLLPTKHDGAIERGPPGCVGFNYRNPDNMTYSTDLYCWRHGDWAFDRTTN